MFAGYDVNKM